MKIFRSARLLLLAFLMSLVPASSFAGVFISINIAPPVLPVYVQPPCPNDGYMWTPGYWAYGDDGYYWVPGAWVPAPQPGYLWTPPYWGWENGVYLFHGGYWGTHVGYYGGVNYGFGYMGVGFAGGEWRRGTSSTTRRSCMWEAVSITPTSTRRSFITRPSSTTIMLRMRAALEGFSTSLLRKSGRR
jgi:hypothetical protein